VIPQALALAAALAAVRPGVLAAPDGDVSASWLSPSLELGDVVPGAPEAPGTPASVMVFSRGTYQLALVRGAREAGPPRTGDADDLRVRTASGGFVPLPPGVPVTVASGSATAGAGAVVTLELRAAATYDAAPGTRRERLRLLLNGQPVDAELVLRWSVAAALSVTPDPRPFDLRTVEPGAPGRYALEPRSYVVTSNVPWRLEALVRDVPKQRGTLEALAPGSLEVATEAGGRKALRPGIAVVVATGSPTGRGGRTISLDLLLSSAGDEAAGLYRGDVEVRVRPADAPATVEAVR
jgi:hypothetical protein